MLFWSLALAFPLLDGDALFLSTPDADLLYSPARLINIAKKKEKAKPLAHSGSGLATLEDMLKMFHWFRRWWSRAKAMFGFVVQQNCRRHSHMILLRDTVSGFNLQPSFLF
jgi:hypothetical protein